MLKNIISGFFICFSMYSIVPMPHMEWKQENMKYVMCFFPVVGLLIGALFMLWCAAAKWLEIGSVLFAAVSVAIPVVVSGGIHMDGYIDTCDAIGSHGDKEKKLDILKDSRTGAFGVLFSALYLLLNFGIYSELYNTPMLWPAAASVFAIGRCIGGLFMVSMTCAKNSGLAYLFSDRAEKKTVRIVFVVELLLLFGFLYFCSAAAAVCTAVVLGIAVICLIRVYSRQFGGITGDLIGFCIQMCELLALFGMVITGIGR